MRQPRLKLEDQNAFYHVYNRVAGIPGYFPFGRAEKDKFVALLRKLSLLYTVEVLSYQVMSNHFHLIVHAPCKRPSPEETCRRYEAYYNGKRHLEPESEECEEMAARLRDISWFMHDLQQQFTTWFNRTRSVRRRGSLWAGRFKHTILEAGQAVWDCLKYVEMNPVRAKMVSSPADYRFCSFGAWSSTGRHPFSRNIRRSLLPALAPLLGVSDLAEIYERLDKYFALAGIEDSSNPEEADDVAFTTRMDRRVRYWVDGLVIGSDIFIKDLMCAVRGSEHMKKRRLARSTGSSTLCSYRRLRPAWN